MTTASADEQVRAFNTVSDLAVGANRYAFVLLMPDGSEVRDAVVSVAFFFIEGDQAIAKGTARADQETMEIDIPHEHKGGDIHAHEEVHSLFVVSEANFDRPGNWGALISIEPEARDSIITTKLLFQVRDESFTPTSAQLVPNTRTPVANAAADLPLLCSRIPPDNMHSVSVDQAFARGQPFVLVFASPSFCQTRICGPVTELVHVLSSDYQDQVNFIHVEPYDLEALRDRGEFVLVESARQWGLISEPWVFVVDGEGKLVAKFEGLLGEQELRQAIEAAN